MQSAVQEAAAVRLTTMRRQAKISRTPPGTNKIYFLSSGHFVVGDLSSDTILKITEAKQLYKKAVEIKIEGGEAQVHNARGEVIARFDINDGSPISG